MTTEHDVMELLGRANPVATDESASSNVSGAEFLAEHRARSSIMTIIQHPPQEAGPASDRPRSVGRTALLAAAAIALVIGLVAIAATRDRAEDPAVVTTPTTVPSTEPGIEESGLDAPTDIAERFAAAQGAAESADVESLLADGFVQTFAAGTPDPSGTTEPADRFLVQIATMQAQGAEFELLGCEPAGDELAVQIERGDAIWCEWTVRNALRVAVDAPAVTEGAVIVVDGDEVIAFHLAVGLDDGVDPYAEIGMRFGEWAAIAHPDDGEAAACCTSDQTVEEAAAAGEVFAAWAQDWTDWLERWGCDATAPCTISAPDWVAEYDAQCSALDDPSMPTAEMVAVMGLVPPPVDARGEHARLLRLDTRLVGLDPDAAAEAARQPSRIDAMTELGIAEACRPIAG